MIAEVLLGAILITQGVMIGMQRRQRSKPKPRRSVEGRPAGRNGRP